MGLDDVHQKGCIDRNFPAPNRNPSLIVRRITHENRMDCFTAVVRDSGSNRRTSKVQPRFASIASSNAVSDNFGLADQPDWLFPQARRQKI